MKKIIENSLKISGFVAGNAEIRKFTNSTVARFSLAINRQEKVGEEIRRVTSYIPFESWRRNDHTETFDLLNKGNLLTVEAYGKSDEYVDGDGKKHNRLVWIATKIYPVTEKEETPHTESKD